MTLRYSLLGMPADLTDFVDSVRRRGNLDVSISVGQYTEPLDGMIAYCVMVTDGKGNLNLHKTDWAYRNSDQIPLLKDEAVREADETQRKLLEAGMRVSMEVSDKTPPWPPIIN